MLYRPLDRNIKNWRDFDKKVEALPQKDWHRAGIDPRWAFDNNKNRKPNE